VQIAGRDTYATSPVEVLKRDFNLDGLLDAGEVRRPGTEKYAIDAQPSTVDRRPPTEYAFNAGGMTEAQWRRSIQPDWDGLSAECDPISSEVQRINTDEVFGTDGA